MGTPALIESAVGVVNQINNASKGKAEELASVYAVNFLKNGNFINMMDQCRGHLSYLKECGAKFDWELAYVMAYDKLAPDLNN